MPRGDPCHKVAKSLAELCSSVLRKANVVSCEMEHVAEEISEESVGGAAWYHLNPHRKMHKGRRQLKKELLSKMGSRPWSSRKCSVRRNCQKMRKKGMAQQPLDNVGVSTGLIGQLGGRGESDAVIPAKTLPV